jgi:transposase InsO family protein
MADSVDGLFHVRGRVLHIRDVPGTFIHATALAASAETWHKRLGHINYDAMKQLHNHSAARNFDVQGAVVGPDEPCDICMKGKHARAPFPTSDSSTFHPLELVHADVIGKMPCESLGGSLYVLTVLDDFSGLSAVACLRHKSAVGEAFKDILATWARQSGRLVKKVRTDGGSEFLADFAACLRGKGIIHERSVRYTPQQNGAAERLNRTLMERTRCMMLDASVPAKFWAEAVATACHVHNMAPSRGESTPWELFYGVKPNLKALRVFGCLAYAQVPQQLRGKLDSRSERGIFIGYKQNVKGWKVLIPCDDGGWHIRVSRDVRFVEHIPGFPALNLDVPEDAVNVDALLDVLPAAADESSVDAQPGNVNVPAQDGVGENSAEEAANAVGDMDDVNTNPGGETAVESVAMDHVHDQSSEAC